MEGALTETVMGMLRIYLRPRDKAPGRGGWFGGRRPLYRELILQAKEAGIVNAIAHHTQFGFSNHGRVEDMGGEVLNPNLTICVELVANRTVLEHFCRTHGTLLAGKVILFAPIELWR